MSRQPPPRREGRLAFVCTDRGEHPSRLLGWWSDHRNPPRPALRPSGPDRLLDVSVPARAGGQNPYTGMSSASMRLGPAGPVYGFRCPSCGRAPELGEANAARLWAEHPRDTPVDVSLLPF